MRRGLQAGDPAIAELTGQAATCPRRGLVYFSDDGDVLALRYDNWEVVFMEQRVPGTLRIWAEPFVALRVPKLFNLRTDPFERGRRHLQHLLRLGSRQRLHHPGRVRDRDPVPGDVQGVPAPPEGRQLNHRPGSRKLETAITSHR
jgi:hypothetical protein